MSKMVNIVEVLNRMGISTVDTDYRSRIDTWLEWYKGAVDDFHSYSVYNGISRMKVERATLGMAKTVCEDFANLLLNEKTVISVEDERAQALLDATLEHNSFTVEGNRAVELAFASGTGAFSEWIDASGVVHIDYHDARQIWPLAWSGHRITECAFVSVDTYAGKKCLYLRMYRLNPDGSQHISNRWLAYDSGSFLPTPDGIEAEVDTCVYAPLFQIIQPNLANNIDTTIPMGISVFANAIDALKAVDIAFDSFKNEFMLGRKRLLVPMSMVKVEQVRDGERAPIFDPTDLVYTAYESSDAVDGFHDLSPEIRAEAHITGLRTQLNLLSFKCGLGTSRYEFDKSRGGVKTATEVISEQSDLYQSVCKHELVLAQALRGLARAICECYGLYAGDVTVTFDDSIIQDRTAQRSEAREEVAQGLMSKLTYLMDIKGMSEEQAREEVERIAKEQRITSGVIDFFDAETAETVEG